MSGPDDAMMAPVRAMVDFMTTLDAARLDGVFADDVVIVENFAPYIFRGPDAVACWREGFRAHAVSLSDLGSSFGAPQDFSHSGERVYFVLPTAWTGRTNGRVFEEEGAWSFVLSRRNDLWTICAYAWAVTVFRIPEPRDGRPPRA